MTDQKDQALGIVCEDMEVFRAEMEAVDRISTKIGNKTSKVIRIVVGLLSVVSVYLLVLTYNMADDLGAMIDSLDGMYVEFGSMSQEMHLMTDHVLSIGTNVSGMPTIVENMQHLNADVGEMVGSMESVNRDITAMDTNVSHIGTTTTEMSYRFQNVQRSVNMMNYDVRQMLRPMAVMPR